MTLRHGEVNSTHEIVKLNCHGCHQQPRSPYLPASAISLELIWISESLLHMTRTAVALLRQMRADYLTVRMCPHAQSGQPAWPPRSRRSSLCRSVIVRKSGRKKKKKLPESHLSVTCERRADEPLYREEGKVANDEGYAFNRDALPVASWKRKKNK